MTTRVFVAAAFVLLLAAPVFGQASLNATPQAPFEGLADCFGFDELYQPFDPANFASARTSDLEAGFLVFEDFQYNPCVASDIRVWGIEVDFDSPTFHCSADDPSNFNVAFWGQSGGTPDIFNQIASADDLSAVETDSGTPFGNFGNVVQYDMSVDDLFVQDSVWFSVQRVNNADSCFWLWVDETVIGTYSDQAYQDGDTGFLTSDQSVCIRSQVADVCSPDDDGGVPATTWGGVVLLALLLVGSSAYFLRGRSMLS